MPGFSLHWSQFLCFGRSRSRPPKPSPADACDDAPVAPLGRGPSRPSSRLGSSEQDVDAAPRVARLSAQQYLATLPSPYVLATPSHPSFDSDPPILPAGQDSLPLRQQEGMFDHARNFSMTGPTFVDSNKGNIAVTNNINTISGQFMKELLKETLPGAASDSSARYPPPQCHPGTRLAVLERCIYFIAHCNGEKQLRWVFGAAGVGKSAIMQSVADSPNLPVTCHVSVFFSINGRDDGSKAILTLSYQLAAKSVPYRLLIESEIARDPSLLQSSMPVQFEKFIIGPFIHNPQLSSAHRVVILIDGLDECNNRDTQLELLRLISDFCITYPSSPLVWLIASRPERHITNFFARANVMPAYEKEEIQVDSDEGRADVERFLREKLEVIKGGSDSFDPQSKWPEEKDFWKLANAAGGLFAYAHTVIRYIDDSNVGNPVSQLSEVLKVIDNLTLTGIPREQHPMALLDALYARILSSVPDKVIPHTRKLILALATDWNHALGMSNSWDRALDMRDNLRRALGMRNRGTFVDLCNWLAMTPDEAYAAINKLQSLLRTPRRDQAHLERLEPFHKSFIDYVSDSSRSDFLLDMHHEAQQLKAECALRVLKEAPDGIDFGDVNYGFTHGILTRGPGTGDKISLTWPVGGCDEDTRLKVYQLAIGEVVTGLIQRDPIFMNGFYIRLLMMQFDSYGRILEIFLPERVFDEDESRRHEFMRYGILKQMPLKAVTGILAPFNRFTLSFHRPARAVTSLSDPWNPSCVHEREVEWEEGKDLDWLTIYSQCSFCSKRFERQLESLKTHSPDHTVLILFTSMGKCCVELRFVDPDDGISEWTYQVWIELSPGDRKKLGSTV